MDLAGSTGGNCGGGDDLGAPAIAKSPVPPVSDGNRVYRNVYALGVGAHLGTALRHAHSGPYGHRDDRQRHRGTGANAALGVDGLNWRCLAYAMDFGSGQNFRS